MQLLLLLLGYVLARYVWGVSQTVSAVVAPFTVFGVLFYLPIVFAATVWKTCPFQTPTPLVLRHTISLVRKYQCHHLQKIRDKLHAVVRFRKLNESFVTATLERPIDEKLAPEPLVQHDALTAALVVDPEEDEGTHASDTNCISRMFRFVSGSDAIVAVTGFVREPSINGGSHAFRVDTS